MPAKEEMTFSSSMSEEDFFKWLKSKGVSDKDRKTLSGKTKPVKYCLLCHYYWMVMIFSENGVTALEFVQSEAVDYDDIGLTKFGKRRILKLLPEVKVLCS